MPYTENWATIIVVVDLVDGVDATTAQAIREAVIDLMVSATDGTEIGVLRASQNADTIVEPVAMGSGRRDAIERVWSAPASGARNIAAALRRAAQLEERGGAISIRRGILLIASDADDSVSRSLRGDSVDDVNVVTYGRDADETPLASLAVFGGGSYGHAVEPADLTRRVADVRRALEQQALVSTGVLVPDATGSANLPIGIGDGQVFARFTTYGIASSAMTITNADGQQFTVEQGSEDVRVSAFGDRVSVGVGAASAGEWQLGVHDAAPGRAIAYDVETFFSPFPEARAEADLDATEGLTIGFMDGGPRPATVTASLLAPDGSERAVELGDAPEENALVCCIGNRYERHLPGPFEAGSYLITVRSVGGEGATRYERAVRFGLYMWPAVDSDGDGIRDQVEIRNGLDPEDPADGALDADGDGLSMSRELGDLGTDPFDYDTDDGGEGDGTEIAADRDPLSAADDEMAASCAAGAENIGSDQFRPQANAPRAPELEALLPDRLLGERLAKTSITGTPLLHPYWPGSLWYALVTCTGGFEPALQVAYASATTWNGRYVVAIRIERSVAGALKPVPAQEVADAFVRRLMPGSVDDLRPQPIELADRSAIILESGMLLYPNDDVLFLTLDLNVGDCWQDCGEPPTMEALATALLPELPAPTD
ncbi:MAG: hypothetical protein C0498_11750 [Anaerolinea sp.]|nr:hypothetical protein [Anaerolinea sp.]